MGADRPITVLPVVDSPDAFHQGIAARLADCASTLVLLPAVALTVPQGEHDWGKENCVVLLDCHAVRARLMVRAVFRVRESGWAGPLLVIVNDRNVMYAATATTFGATDFVLSTATAAELQSRIRCAVAGFRRDEAVTALPLPDGSEVQLCWRTREIVCNEIRVTLTNRELQLIGAFIADMGRTLSATELGLKAWGRDEATESSMAPYVSSLRKKLAWFGDRFGIRTVRNAGYRFEVSAMSSFAMRQRELSHGPGHPRA